PGVAAGDPAVAPRDDETPHVAVRPRVDEARLPGDERDVGRVGGGEPDRERTELETGGLRDGMIARDPRVDLEEVHGAGGAVDEELRAADPGVVERAREPPGEREQVVAGGDRAALDGETGRVGLVGAVD